MALWSIKASEALRTLRSNYYRLKFKKIHQELSELKLEQKNSFESLAREFQTNYIKINKGSLKKFTTPLWKRFNKEVEKALLPIPPFDFLRNPTIMVSMFATSGGKWLDSELRYLEQKVPKKKLKKVLLEDYIGDPLLFNSNYVTSHTTIHHMYHLIKFEQAIGIKLESLKTFIEWGGGYGNLIKLLKRYTDKPRTYIMIDIPLFSCLQWLYLSIVFGKRQINFVSNSKHTIIRNKINIVPLPFIDTIKIKADLFISTWAISESSKYSQDYVVKTNWFGAKHILLAYQDNPSGLFNPSRVGRLAKDKGAIIEDMEFLPGNHYAFL